MILRILKLILFIFFLNVTFVLAQATQQEIDSLILRAKEVTAFDESSLLLEKAIEQSKAINYTKGLTSAVLTKGVNLFNQTQFEEALIHLENWEKVIIAANDAGKIAHLYALRGNCYSRLSFFDQSNEYLNKALNYALKITNAQARNNNLARIYAVFANNVTGNTSIPLNIDSLLYYRKKSYGFAKDIAGTGNAKSFLIIQAVGIGKAYLLKKKLDSAKHYFDLSLALVNQHKLEKYAVEIYMNYAEINSLNKQLNEAVTNYKTALSIARHTKNLANIAICNQKLAKLYEEIGNLEKSEVHLKEFSKITDSLIPVHTKAVKTASDLIVKDKEEVFKEKKTNYVLIVAVIVLTVAALVYFLVISRKRQEKIDQLHRQKQQFLEEKLEYLKTKTVNDKIDDQALKEIINLAAANDPTFLTKFQELHPVFIQRILEKAPNLVNADLLICAQLRLGFYTKEIARYTNTSVRAVEGKKYRVRKKLEIPPTDDINVWMMQV